MSASIPDFPISWVRDEASHGNQVLLGFDRGAIHLLAAPGVRIQIDEPDRERVCWRYAIWEEDAEVGPPVISIDPPDAVSHLGSAEVVQLLPSELHDFVRIEMARQLCRAATFGKPPEGERPLERHARLAGRTVAWTSTELAKAFPDERWFELEEPIVCIPHTVDELLAQMPASGESVARRHRWTKLTNARHRLGQLWIRAEHRAASALRWVGRSGGRSERLSRRLDRRTLDESDGLLGGHSELTR